MMPDSDFARMFQAGIPVSGIRCPDCGVMLIRPEQAGSNDAVPTTCPACGVALEYYQQQDDLGMFHWWRVRAALKEIK